LPPGSPAWNRIVRWCTGYPNHWSYQTSRDDVKAIFKDDENVAYTPVGGDTIYFQVSNALHFSPTDRGPSSTLMGMLLHEIMHTLGKNDIKLRAALDIDEYAKSGAIIDKLKDDCFSGKK
jgi:hypothetical protein